MITGCTIQQLHYLILIIIKPRRGYIPRLSSSRGGGGGGEGVDIVLDRN